MLLVAATRRVVAEDPPAAGLGVVPAEQGDGDQSLHRETEVAAHERAEPVGLAVEGQSDALELLVVLELHLEEPDQLDGDAGAAGDADARELVRREDLLDVALRDVVASGGAPVTGHHHAAGERRRDDRRAVRSDLGRDGGTRQAAPGQQVRRVAGEELREGGGAERTEGRRQAAGDGRIWAQRSPLVAVGRAGYAMLASYPTGNS